MSRAFLPPFLAAVAGSAIVILGGSSGIVQLYSELIRWRETVQAAPEGRNTGVLFTEAVKQGAIAWNPVTHSVELRRNVAMPTDLRAKMFRVGEGGAVIAKELDRLSAFGSYAAIRVRYVSCPAPCARSPKWTLRKLGEHSSGRERALAAEQAKSSSVPAPPPRVHFRLSRDSDGDYTSWTAWHLHDVLSFETISEDIDRIDVIGRLKSTPPGWKILSQWCRDDAGRLGTCEGEAIASATRFVPDGVGQQIRLKIEPAAIFPARPVAGTHFLSDRVALSCDSEGVCEPRWISQNGSRRYARDNASQNSALQTDLEAVALNSLSPWVRVEDGALRLSDLVTATGAEVLVGGLPPRTGSILAASRDLPKASKARFTLDPVIQGIANNVLENLLKQSKTGAFDDLSYRFPSEGARASLVVLDLRSSEALGAIRAAVGVPKPQTQRSEWDMTAAAYDTFSPIAPGVPAWTGRGWHHIPGSAWKVFNALALIDAVTDPRMSPENAANLRAALIGLNSADLDRVFGKGSLTAPGGLCVPILLADGVKGAGPRQAGDAICGAGYYAPIKDSGRGGPLANDPDFRFGMRTALSVSSNIWFAAAVLNAESSLQVQRHGLLFEQTAQRLGFLEGQRLDSGIGLALDVRDAVDLEVLSNDYGTQALALAAFGQRVQAGPLILAQLSASVATGKDVRPGLFEPLAPAAPLFETTQARTLLQEVREGMRGVVSGEIVGPGGRTGTGSRPFRERASTLRPRIAGKTGTAERDSGLERISTFTGWLEDREGGPSFAIGCSVTLLGSRTGSGVTVPPLCAHVVAELMKRLDDEVMKQ